MIVGAAVLGFGLGALATAAFLWNRVARPRTPLPAPQGENIAVLKIRASRLLGRMIAANEPRAARIVDVAIRDDDRAAMEAILEAEG